MLVWICLFGPGVELTRVGQRCKRKKIKCFYNSANTHRYVAVCSLDCCANSSRKCVACVKSRSGMSVVLVDTAGC